MRMAELSSRSGVPIPTIKYYLREGLLPAGERTSPNQVRYEDEHVRRLRLIRALVDVGGLSVAAARAVLDKVDTPDIGSVETLGKVQYALTPQREPQDDAAWRQAAEEVDELLRGRGWQVRPTNPARASLTEVIAVLHRLGRHEVLGMLGRYADAAHLVAAGEVDLVRQRSTLEDQAESVVVLGVLGDALLTALRRLAQEDLLVRATAADSPAIGS